MTRYRAERDSPGCRCLNRAPAGGHLRAALCVAYRFARETPGTVRLRRQLFDLPAAMTPR